MSFNDMVKEQRTKNIIKFSLGGVNLNDTVDDMTPQEQEKVDEICWNCQVNDPMFTRVNGDLIMSFSYYDGDPEYYFEEYDIQQDSMNSVNIINVTRVMDK